MNFYKGYERGSGHGRENGHGRGSSHGKECGCEKGSYERGTGNEKTNIEPDQITIIKDSNSIQEDEMNVTVYHGP
ncbi:hypothetical protein C1645_835762 [Glomus cerebriforme]|uniref:Uncharacterized protein n=1 Tax=Glomus cerebriforme TaxID=658196 RepID=A0A397SBG7_9GLOM|nr:hypothetical protein C1645_835762 [Glomus cerebriforme]